MPRSVYAVVVVVVAASVVLAVACAAHRAGDAPKDSDPGGADARGEGPPTPQGDAAGAATPAPERRNTPRRASRVESPAGDEPPTAAVEEGDAAGLPVDADERTPDWLERNQRDDGAWGRGDGNDARATGLVLLVYLAAGETHRAGTFKQIVGRGLQFLRSLQSEDGRVGSTDGPEGLEVHVVAASALIEAYAVTKDDDLRLPAERALARTLAAQGADGGWGRSEVAAGDVVVTAAALEALSSAKAAGLSPDPGAFHRARTFVDGLTDAATGQVRRSAGADRAPDPLATAAGTYIRLQCRRGLDDGDPGADERILLGAAWLASHPPTADADTPEGDPAYARLSGYVADALGGETYAAWKAVAERATIETQVLTDESGHRGSWDPGGGRDRVVGTANRYLAMQIFFRYGRVVGGR